MILFRYDESVYKTYSIADILAISVEIITLKRSRLMPQGKKCQAYGHT